MTELLGIKNRIVRLAREYETYLIPFFKFLTAYLAFCMIRSNLGFDARLGKTTLLLILALVCALLPVNAIVLFSAALILINLYALSLWTAITALLCFIVIYLVYFRFAPKNGVAAVLTPIAFRFQVPFIMPIGAGLLSGPYSVISVLCGTVVYELLHGIALHSSEIAELEADEEAKISTKVNIILRQLIGNKDMYLLLAVFTVTAILVYLIRRIHVDHAWTLAIVSGTLFQMVGLFVGYMTLNISGKTSWLLIGNIAAMLLAFLLQFFFMDLDYNHVERVQFEDDDYYYYVKAVPKKLVASGEKTVIHFGKKSAKTTPEDAAEAAASEERKNIAKELDIDEELLK